MQLAERTCWDEVECITGQYLFLLHSTSWVIISITECMILTNLCQLDTHSSATDTSLKFNTHSFIICISLLEMA